MINITRFSKGRWSLMGEQPITLSNYLPEVNNNNKKQRYFFYTQRNNVSSKSIIVWAFTVVSVMKVMYAYQGACLNMRVFESNSCPPSERLRDFCSLQDSLAPDI